MCNTLSYREQYKRMKRWYRRLQDIYKGIEHKVDSDYYQDEVYAFFQNCYHLKDWLKNDPEVVISDEIIEAFASNKCSAPVCMRICGDLCNGSKHMIITRNVKIDKNTKVGRRLYHLKVGVGREAQILAVEYEIECLGKTYDALSLAESCISEWDKFMTKHNIPIPSDT